MAQQTSRNSTYQKTTWVVKKYFLNYFLASFPNITSKEEKKNVSNTFIHLINHSHLYTDYDK